MPSCLGSPSPLVLVESISNRQLVIIASDEARACGIRPGLTLAQAIALCPQLQHADHEPHKDHRALESLGRWMMRFTPLVMAEDDHNEPGKPRPARPHHELRYALFLDLTGCERVFHGIDNLLRRVATSLTALHIHARLAVAPTPGAAWALTFADQTHSEISNLKSQICDPQSAIQNLPVSTLRLTDDLNETLHHLGIHTIAQLLQLPRNLLPSRFGPLLLTRLDQALGNIAEPLVPLTYQPPIEARIDFDGVVESPEAMWGVFQQLIGQIIVELHRRGHGVRNLEVRFQKSYGPTISRTILLSRPTRDAKNLFNLFRCILDAVTAPPKKSAAPQRITPAGRNVTDGFAGLHLRVVISEPLAEEQIHLLDSEQYVGQMELAHLIERLRLRLGEKTFVQPELIEAYVPEKTYRIAEPQVKVEDAPTSNGAASARPLCLLSSPIEVKAMVSPSDDRDGKPILFTHNRHVHHIVHSVGPERISGQWWEGHNKTRDYFDVESPNGKRFWIFRVMETGKWYLHGIFE